MRSSSSSSSSSSSTSYYETSLSLSLFGEKEGEKRQTFDAKKEKISKKKKSFRHFTAQHGE